MKNAVKEFIEMADDEKRQLWEKAVFVFDTNVLLNLYRYSAKTRNLLFNAIASFNDRVWIPYHVACEFMERRCEVIYESMQRYTKIENDIHNLTQKIKTELRLSSEDNELSKLNDLSDSFITWLNHSKNQNLLVKNQDNDEILEKVLLIFDGRVGPRITADYLELIEKEGKERYEKQIPPGYRDQKKTKHGTCSNNAYGDLIIWKQIIEFAKKHQVDIIYITNDKKEDWWNIVEGKTIGPRAELRREFIDETHQKIHMYSMENFIKTFSKFNKGFIDQSIEEEVKSFMGISQEVKLNMIVDDIVGDIGDTFDYDGIKFNYESIITEDMMKECSRHLRELYPVHVNQSLWFPVRFRIGEETGLSMRKTIDTAIDSGNWMGENGSYSYSESERQEIMRRCAEKIKQRLEKYAGEYIIKYKIFPNGELGLRYE